MRQLLSFMAKNGFRRARLWRGAVEKSEAKLKEKASQYLKKELDIEQPQERISSSYLQTVLSDLKLIAQSNGIKFVHGIGKRKTSIQKQRNFNAIWNSDWQWNRAIPIPS